MSHLEDMYETSATPDDRIEIQQCLQSISCVSANIQEGLPCQEVLCLTLEGSQKDSGGDEKTLGYVSRTVQELYEGRSWEVSEKRQILECQVELLLCSLPGKQGSTLQKVLLSNEFKVTLDFLF